MVGALKSQGSSLDVFLRAAGSHGRFLSGGIAPSRMVSVVTPTSLPCLLMCTSTETSIFLFSTPVHPFFAFLPSEGKLCQHSALLTVDSHLLMTKGYRKKKRKKKKIPPPFDHITSCCNFQEYPIVRGDCPSLS